MPPGRRGRPAGSSTRSKIAPQQRLSFGGRNATNKVTKPTQPSSLAQDAKKKLSPTQKKSKIEDEITPAESPTRSSSSPSPAVEEPQQPENKTLPIRKNEKVEKDNKAAVEERDAREVEALKVSEAQIKKFWAKKEESRIMPRVHQQGMSMHEKILREFDLSNQYGPCIGIPRLKRWKRADSLGLKPPIEVLATLLKEEEAKGRNDDVQTAYIDCLMGGKIEAEET